MQQSIRNPQIACLLNKSWKKGHMKPKVLSRHRKEKKDKKRGKGKEEDT